MSLFDPAVFGALNLSNRVVMAPLTRTRADDAGVPTDTMVEYYRQRAGQGLIISEGVWPAAEGKSLPSNHSPFFAPVVEPTLTTGVTAMTTAALAWLDSR